jgi:hypothetical protein
MMANKGVALTTGLILSTLLVLTSGVCKTGKLTAEESAVLDAHNALRAKHKDTPPLCYGKSGDDVTFDAQKFADKTGSRDKASEHSKNKPFGENLAGGANTNVKPNEIDAYKASVENWYSNKKDYPQDHNQVLWKSTKQVNCGYKDFKYTLNDGKLEVNAYKVVCQYFPAGNTNAGATNIGEVKDNVNIFRASSATGKTVGMTVFLMLLTMLLQ